MTNKNFFELLAKETAKAVYRASSTLNLTDDEEKILRNIYIDRQTFVLERCYPSFNPDKFKDKVLNVLKFLNEDLEF